MFYNVFQGFGEIGSDILRLSNVKESSSRERPQDHLTYSTSLRDNTTTARADLDTKTLGSDSLKGVTRIVKSTIRAPMTFTFAMAQGAHNAPRLWGDKTVRDQDKITGLASGVVAAGKVCCCSLRSPIPLFMVVLTFLLLTFKGTLLGNI